MRLGGNGEGKDKKEGYRELWKGRLSFVKGVEYIHSIAFDMLLLLGLTASPFWIMLAVKRIGIRVCRLVGQNLP